MRLSKLIPLVLAAVVPLDAFAGGIGLLGTAGVHTDRVYYYDSSDDYAQYLQHQTLPNYGGGLEVVLGDRDDRLQGVFRGFYLQDSPQSDPAGSSDVPSEYVVARIRDTPRHLGIGTVGLQWGVLGQPENFMANVSVNVGAGFLTEDKTEFMVLDAGVGATYTFARNLQAHASLLYTLRFRKTATHGATAYAGVRFLFD